MEAVTLYADSCVLTPYTPSDIANVVDLCQDPDIQKWTTVPTPYTRDNAESFVLDIATDSWKKGSPIWAIRENLDGPVVGSISITLRDTGVGEVGYWLGASYRQRGITTAAVNAVADYAFDTLGFSSLRWSCAIIDGETNWASARVAWKCGFTFEGTVRRMAALKSNGPAIDFRLASLLPGESRTPKGPWFGPTSAHPAFADPRDVEALVRQFHETYALPIVEDGPNADRPRVHMRLGLVAEEFAELVGAVYGSQARAQMEEAFRDAVALDDASRDTIEVADALGDLVYVIYGMALELGIPLRDVLAEIQGSNLSKLGSDGKPIYREDGKVLKGPHFYPPNIRRALGLEHS